MKNIFIDASHSLTVGLLDESWNWIKFETTDQLPSITLHQSINQIIGNESWDKIDRFFFCKGPGSYTGLRLIEGLEQYLKFEKIKCHDFYSFELREILGLKNSFLYSAFKGQYLLSNKENILYNLEEIDESLDYYGEKLDERFNYKSILDLIKKESKKIFPYIKNNESKKIYYFRPLSEEFKK